MDELRAALPRHHWEAKSHGMRLCHVRSHDQNAVAILQIFLQAGGRPAAQCSAQTGHRCAVSYPGLVFDRHNSHAGIPQLLHQIIFFHIERRPAQAKHVAHMIHHIALFVLLDEAALARVLH